ncbi:TPA: type II toxin-antitoxin system ChpB family toxin [Serratia marcescens]|uniref:type II toxin-antitoxin system ChpB family toxin n=1 Tax=Serratia marcescens TaxID=615 RepID=UPI000E1D0A1D|nr:type II toxin-antitoxin system ChpB family toxin [Serratia marcescens]AXK26360.1 Programmed cell death toxin ChpB [Serratia marcescens]MBH2528678.1 type II toxin-antitoxin system ChpB family toxin [Serratia marcescens]MBH2889415.1 type II toxin-antitoxin system ChpB family toxin [Serratia marcescens]MBH3000172.1 type II toxin-antitoxin system ChpB family toxin [Serratia marcescens]MBH3139513.1 type II toxin-antitoxin system ChpB family toxin [Serratia marcescens]
MVKRPVFQRGDLIRVSLNPVVGREQQGDLRPALVLSPREFNALGMVLVAPISQGANFARTAGFTVSLSGSGTATQGVILINQVRMMDLAGRSAQFIERAPGEVIADALARLQAIID